MWCGGSKSVNSIAKIIKKNGKYKCFKERWFEGKV